MSVKRLAAIFHAAVNGDADEIKSIIRKIVDEKETSGRTALMQSAIYGHNKVLEQLLVFGAVPDIGDNDQNTALHEACQTGCLDTVHILLKYGANINVRNSDGDSPLHLAAYGCNPDIVELLLDEGADVNMKNRKRQTPKDKLGDTEKSSRYEEEAAKEILELLHEWRAGKPVRSKKSAKSQKEENITCLKEIKENVQVMSTSVMTLVEKIDSLGDELKVTTMKLKISEEKASTFEKQLTELKHGVGILHEDLLKNGETANNKLTKLIDVTESIYDNLCQSTDFNDRVYHSIFHKIAVTVGSKPDCWRTLAEKLFEGYPLAFVKDQINETLAAYQNDTNRAHECLLKWKVIVGTWMHKLGPLKSIIRKLEIGEQEELCNEIDEIIHNHTIMSHEEPTGSLTEKGLLVIAKQLGMTWHEVGIQLDFTTANLDSFRESYPHSDDRNHHMLVEWVRREPGFNNIKLGRLVEALKLSGRSDLASDLYL